MKRLMLMIVACLAVVVVAQTPRTYSVTDLPAGWTWDATKIQGTLLPVVYSATRPTNDPNLWLVPCGTVLRAGITNDWVKEVKLISAIGPALANLTVFLDQDPVTKKSKTWRLEGPSVPGPFYITVDAIGQPGKNGQSKTTRYTIVGAGYAPDGYIPFLW